MPVAEIVTGIPRGRYEITALQREVVGRMIDVGILSQSDLARHLGVEQWTLNKTLRGRRANPAVLKKILKFLGKDISGKGIVPSRKARGRETRFLRLDADR